MLIYKWTVERFRGLGRQRNIIPNWRRLSGKKGLLNRVSGSHVQTLNRGQLNAFPYRTPDLVLSIKVGSKLELPSGAPIWSSNFKLQGASAAPLLLLADCTGRSRGYAAIATPALHQTGAVQHYSWSCSDASWRQPSLSRVSWV